MEKINLCGKFSQVYWLECEWDDLKTASVPSTSVLHGAVSSRWAFIEEIFYKTFYQ